MSRKENALVCFDPLLRKDPELRPVLPQILQLRIGRDAVVQFMNKAADVCQEVNDSVRTSCLLAFRICKETESFPAMEFELITALGERLVLSSRGVIGSCRTTQTAVPAEQNEIADAPGFQEIEFSGLREVEFRGFAELLYSSHQCRLNDNCVQDFLGAPPEVSHRWEVDKLFQYYLDNGNDKWLAPVQDLAKVERSHRHLNGHRRVILDFMADAGRLGFCPTQFLRRVLMPQLRENGDLHAFEAAIQAFFSAVQYVQQILAQTGGDGSASNLFTLKYFVRNLACQKSKLYRKGFYDRRGSMEEVFQALARSWGRAFAVRDELRSVKSHIVRTYLDSFLRTLIRIEMPYEIVVGIERAMDHLDKMSSLAATTLGGEVSSLFPWSLQHVFEQMERTIGPGAQLLGLLQKHMEVMEQLMETNRFGFVYRGYLEMLSRGGFEEPQDIDFYFEVYQTVGYHRLESIERMNFLGRFIKEARDPDARRDLVSFLTDSPLMEGGLYLKWKYASPEKRTRMLDEVKGYLEYYLYRPSGRQFRFSFDLDRVALERAAVLNLVRCSFMSKSAILTALTLQETNLPRLTRPFMESQRFEVRERPALTEADAAFKHRDIRFLSKKTRVVSGLFALHAGGSRPDFRLPLIRAAVEHLKKLLARVKELTQRIEEPEKRERAVKGVISQASGVKAFLRFLRACRKFPMKDARVTGLVVEAGLIALSYDKAFHKKFADKIARLVLSHQWRVEDVLELSLPPYVHLENLPDHVTAYRYEVLEGLDAVYTTLSQQYFVDTFVAASCHMTDGHAEAMGELMRAVGIPHLSQAPATVQAGFFHRIFTKYQGTHLLAVEKEHYRKACGASPGQTRQIALVPARREMDKFFGAVGENCTCGAPQEIRREAFIPVRIVDADRDRLEGYVHLLVTSYGGERVLLVPGIEPKVSLIDHLDAPQFYEKTKDAIIAWAEKGGFTRVLIPTNPFAHSNRKALAALMLHDLDGRPVVDLGRISFPEDGYEVGTAVEIWHAAEEAGQRSGFLFERESESRRLQLLEPHLD